MLGDPSVMRFLGGNALGREDAWRRMLCAPAMWSFLGYGYWAVARKDDDAMIGQTGFADFKRDMVPSIEGVPEMGWVFAAEAGGQGYASEAAAAALAWIDAARAPPEVVAIIDPLNTASIRVAEKVGFAHREDAAYRGEPILQFRRTV
jgi:RimJ/RimL family protein N-acetyltransferase